MWGMEEEKGNFLYRKEALLNDTVIEKERDIESKGKAESIPYKLVGMETREPSPGFV